MDPDTFAAQVLWQPDRDARTTTVIGRYLEWLERERGLSFADYADLWEWSVTDLDGFWGSVRDHFTLPIRGETSVIADGEDGVASAKWFGDATCNVAEHLLAGDTRGGGELAVIARSQTRGPVDLTWSDLRSEVARVRRGLVELGVSSGDRVAAYSPNIPETLIGFLATASLGAIWSSCAPEFGVQGVLDRFRQIEPTVLIVIDGYRYGKRTIDRSEEVAAIRAGLDTLRSTVMIDYLEPGRDLSTGMIRWSELDGEDDPGIRQVPFDHPLYILYSSGTTGLPKPIVHGHGGILIEHHKALALHGDVSGGDRFFWFTTTGWMMWNFLVSALGVGATIVLFDGDPGWPDLNTLWSLADECRITSFGVSAPFLDACRRDGLEPARRHDLGALRAVGSTGAPLLSEGFEWVYDQVGGQVLLGSISGGTDVCTAFVGAVPLREVRSGIIPCRYLGARVESFDPKGVSLVGQEGELVVTAPMPSMPVGLWGDTDGSRMHASYFEKYPGVWWHGDWITIDATGQCVISGRSDATLNRGGVRLGTADFYEIVEDFDEVTDSLVVHLEDAAGGPGNLMLFTSLTTGRDLDDELVVRLRDALRQRLSPRHVPDSIIAVPGIPRTLSGKKLEIPIKRLLQGKPVSEVLSRSALINPTSIDAFEAMSARFGNEATNPASRPDGRAN